MKNIKFYIAIIIALGCYSAKAQNDYEAPQPSDGNYVFTRTYQEPKNDETEILLKSDVVETVQYFDGLGRPQQNIGIGQSPNGADLVTPVQYDDYGRMVREWLPFVAPDDLTRGNFEAGSLLAIQQYYKDNYGDDFPNVDDVMDINAFSEKKLETSPLNRVLKQGAPGKDWALGADNTDHVIGFVYSTNSHDLLNPTDSNNDNVRLFSVVFTGGDSEVPELSNNGYYMGKRVGQDNHPG